ncbi:MULTISPECIES: GMC family oxidoreductase N-terminal domain-containing protein [unclassified Chelatococcus]|uniref:GMC family oxidoreductase n=1 Tax=unclassified Chelatococcus TaxID=2638111 RepID=UPI001BCBAE5D|nr:MULTISPECIES: GMC family oxidoreductase N-terminal domain-containing protein [unclassified Chelatococcus]MBS7699685.1 GMC family oxidoreductase N-terminal domain-containing protein [Chelatococcus sp. YT9]MBX3557117.1 GMC family oxidoreductase N-terminal domain-containing protein [Chelatococcus sp.]
MQIPDEVDYIVVGAGAAGCIVASRLAEDGRASVCLIEAGGRDSNPWVKVPIGYARLMNNPKVNWGYSTQPEAGLNGREIRWPRGKLLGGSASINGLVFLRGSPGDFDLWENAGARGWSYADVLPAFEKLERCLYPGAEEGRHGFNGPIPVAIAKRPSAVAQAFVKAALELGYSYNPDFNGQSLAGAGFLPFNVERGRRHTSAATYLRPAMRHGAKIHLQLNTLVHRVIFEDRRATGVVIAPQGAGAGRILRARREVILCGGAVNSPQLLMLSGIGDAQALSALGIAPVIHSPQVGRGLQDHLMARFAFRCTRAVTLNDIMRNPFRIAGMGARYALSGTGPMAISAAEASLFVPTQAQPKHIPPSGDPALQFQVANFSLDSYETGLHPFPGFVYSACVCRPDSRGEVTLASSDPHEKPLIAANYLSETYDQKAMIEGFRIGRKLAGTRALSPWIAEELKPGRQVRTDESLIAYIRETASTTFHPCGTVAMGGEQAPLDPSLRVRGVEGLRVIDAAVMPIIPSTNIHAATLMVAERGSAIVRSNGP